MTAHIRMIDVSSNNHPSGKAIDWRAVRDAGYGAAMIKCSEGADYVNPWRRRDGEAAHAAGMLVGYYHFAHPGVNAQDTELAFALAAIDGLPRTSGLALDLEVTEGRSWQDLAGFAHGFLDGAKATITHSELYVNQWFLDNLPGAPFGHRLWLAASARPRREVWAWQEATPIAVPGIEGLTDVGLLHPDA